jgi:hypothetical protein
MGRVRSKVPCGRCEAHLMFGARVGCHCSRVTLGEAVAVKEEGIHMTYLGCYQGHGR